MWLLKIRGFDDKNIFGAKAVKHKVHVHYYPFNYYLEKGNYYFIALGLVDGPEKNIEYFFRDLRNDKIPSKNGRWVVKIEAEGNFFVCVTAQSRTVEAEKYVHVFYNPKFIHVNPAIIRPDGHEEWNIASFERKDLENLIHIARESYNGEILLLKKTKLRNMGLFSIFPGLTEKQKTAFGLAVNNGYYEYPRKTELKKLSRLMNISLSTYQAHLRKTERKLLPFIYRKYF